MIPNKEMLPKLHIVFLIVDAFATSKMSFISSYKLLPKSNVTTVNKTVYVIIGDKPVMLNILSINMCAQINISYSLAGNQPKRSVRSIEKSVKTRHGRFEQASWEHTP